MATKNMLPLNRTLAVKAWVDARADKETFLQNTTDAAAAAAISEGVGFVVTASNVMGLRNALGIRKHAAVKEDKAKTGKVTRQEFEALSATVTRLEGDLKAVQAHLKGQLPLK